MLMYAPLRGRQSGGVLDIKRYMDEMGLKEGEHYVFKSFSNLLGDATLREICDGVVLAVPARNSFRLGSGAIGGYSKITSFLKTNRSQIKSGLENGVLDGD